jgi:hypothetical protein
MFVHVPFAGAPSAAEHTSHDPPQAPSQQTPSTQLPLWHWFAAEQDWPSPRFASQLGALQ